MNIKNNSLTIIQHGISHITLLRELYDSLLELLHANTEIQAKRGCIFLTALVN